MRGPANLNLKLDWQGFNSVACRFGKNNEII